MRGGLRAEFDQFRELTRLFFGRFLENDLIALDGDIKPALVNILALLAAPGILIPLMSQYRYSLLNGDPLFVRDIAALGDKGFYLSFSMAVLAIVTVLESDALFPDMRDYLILRPFPIRLDIMFAAKLAALGAFWMTFIVAINSLCTLLFPLIVAQRATALEVLWMIRAHAIAVVASSAFVFLALVSAQGVVNNVFSVRISRRVSPYLQGSLIIGLLFGFFVSSEVMRGIGPGRPSTAILRAFPPAWFLGLYQCELGWRDPVFTELAALAKRGLAVAGAAALVSYALSYTRHVRKSLEVLDAPAVSNGWMARLLLAFADRFVVRNSEQRAAFHFIWQTLFRSRRHRVLVAAYTAGGFALVFQSLAGVVARGGSAWWSNPRGVLLPVPIVLPVFLLFGIRYAFTVPAELRANWLFQLSALGDPEQYMAGVRKAVLLIGVVPMFAVLLPIHLILWPWPAACIHILFGASIAILLADGLLAAFEKLPFTCTYVSGKSNMQLMWPVYVAAFATYVSLLSAFEYWILSQPLRVVWLFVFAAAVEGLIRLYRRRVFVQSFEFIFEDRPDPAVRTLNLIPP